MWWQVQDAKQRFSELLRTVRAEGPQIVTRHGEEIAVVIDIADYRHMRGDIPEFKDYLRSGPGFDDLDLTRATERPRDTDWAHDS
jgi:prevent-host-death family protein